MCGIVGLMHKHQAVSRGQIKTLTQALSSRGPDDQGIWLDGNKALGHRRLSIIDLDGGHQPMFSDDGVYGIVFNGELYNYQSLRVELQQKGHHFHSESDTEVLLHAYMQWQEGCLQKLRGMFAFAIIDKKQERFFLARDHLGIKPLVYYAAHNTFAFASELQALRKLKILPFTISVEAMDQYLWLQYIPAPSTIYQEVKKLAPAHYLHVTFDGEVHQSVPYWDVTFQTIPNLSEQQWLDTVDETLRESVKTHLVSDVPFGAFLSGGIDSSLIVQYMADILGPENVQAFSIGFVEKAFNELSYAQEVVDQFGIQHHQATIRPDVLDVLPKLVSHYGEPFGDSSAVPTYYLSRLTRQYVPMVLSGDGADELFAGYASYQDWQYFLQTGHSRSWRDRLPLRSQLSKLSLRHFPPVLSDGVSLQNWLRFVQYFPPHTRQFLWKKPYRQLMAQDIPLLHQAYEESAQLDPVKQAQYMDMKTYLPFAVLTKVDIASMMHGVEVRTPFVDKQVIECAAQVPTQWNMHHVADAGVQGKYLLKRLLEKSMGRQFVYRKKMGFAMPLSNWFAHDGKAKDFVQERLLSEHSTLATYFESKEIAKLIRYQHVGPIWLLLFLEEWLRQEAQY